MRRFLAGDEERDNPRATNRLEFEGEGDLDTVPSMTHVYVVSLKEGATPVSLTPGYESYDQPAWFPDSTHIICAGPSTETTHPDRDLVSDLYVISTTDSVRGHLRVEGYSLNSPKPSPDGTIVAFLAVPKDQVVDGQATVGIEYLDGKTPGRLVSAKLDRNAVSPHWSVDGKDIYFTAPSNGGAPLFRVGINKESFVERLSSFDGSTGAFDISGGEVAMVRSKITNLLRNCARSTSRARTCTSSPRTTANGWTTNS